MTSKQEEDETSRLSRRKFIASATFGSLLLIPYRLPVDYAAAIIVVFAAIFVIHYARRAFRQPLRPESTSAVTLSSDTVKAYDLVQRLFHWSLFIVLGLVALTGVNIFYPGSFNFLLSPFGIVDVTSSIFWHTTLLWVLLAIVVIHVVWDGVVARGWSNIWVKGSDISDTFTRLKNFFGVTKEYPRSPKYDVFMKTFHWGAVLSIVVLGVTGLFMWNPYSLLPAISPGLDNLFRVLHDIFTFLFVGLILGHIYFAVLPVNWPVLRSMITGSLSKEVYLKEFDSERWPVVKGKTSPAAKAVGPMEAAKAVTEVQDAVPPPRRTDPK